MSLTTDQCLTKVRNIAQIPDTGADGSRDADLIEHIDDAFQEMILPQIAAIRENYFLVRRRYTLAAGDFKVRIDPRAMWNKLKDLYWVDTDTGDRVRLDPIPHDELHQYNTSGATRPEGYMIQGNDIRLVPEKSPEFDGSLEQAFYFRPGRLIKVANGRQVASVDSATKITLDSAAPAAWSASSVHDIHSQESGAEIKSWGLTVSSLPSTTEIIFNEAIDGSVFGNNAVEVGDWVVLENEATIPGVPTDFIHMLVREAANRYLESVGDSAGLQAGVARYDRVKDLNVRQAEERVEDKPLRLGGRGMLSWTRRYYY